MAIPYFADLHCHPSMKPFRQEQVTNIFDTIKIQPSCQNLNIFTRPTARDIVKESQTNISKCQQGRLRVVLASIYTPERKFFDLTNLFEFLLDTFAPSQTVELGVCMTGFRRALIQEYVDAHDRNRDKPIDHFSETQKEYEYMVQQSAQTEGFQLVGDYAELQKVLTESDDTVAAIPTIEGMHSLTVFSNFEQQNVPFEAVNDTSNPYYEHFALQFKINIKRVKEWGDGRHAPLFITYTHYFWNLLCGHAKSLDTPALSQRQNLGKGFSQLGKTVLHTLLSRENGRRILPDIKHMSVQTRKEFFGIWRSYQQQGDNFPIICSHTAITGKATLNDLADSRDSRGELENVYFNTWSINIADEEIRYIHESGGLIGLIFHDERMPGGISQKILRDAKECGDFHTMRDEYVRLWMSNALHIVKTVGDASGWDLICIGSDYDGIINGFDIYHDVMSYPDFQNHVIQYLNRPIANPYVEGLTTVEEIKSLYFGLTPDEIAEKILYKNVDNFLQRYYHDGYLKHAKLVDVVA
ncbi:MAG TPA: hypothetical protein DCS93_41945 [Microscillaceae bacterium]|nr:hypothetical protein [Microscillaceae bacterium]